MIATALSYIRDLLNQHFKNEFSISENRVVLSNIENTDGHPAADVDGKIVLFLVSLEEEASLIKKLNRPVSSGQGAFAQKQPPLQLNLQIMCCANFMEGDYIEGLKFLSSVMRFFQTNQKIFPNPKTKKKDTIEKLTFELIKLDFSELSQLWSAIGSKLMPSVLYKVSVVVFDDAPVIGMVPPIKETESQT